MRIRTFDEGDDGEAARMVVKSLELIVGCEIEGFGELEAIVEAQGKFYVLVPMGRVIAVTKAAGREIRKFITQELPDESRVEAYSRILQRHVECHARNLLENPQMMREAFEHNRTMVTPLRAQSPLYRHLAVVTLPAPEDDPKDRQATVIMLEREMCAMLDISQTYDTPHGEGLN